MLLAALLHFGGQRGWLLAALAFASDVSANLPAFPPLQAVALGLCNLTQVTVTWLLMRRIGASPGLERVQEFGKFVLAGPLLGALCSALLAGAVLLTLERVSAPYPTLVLLWWFGDALGLLIFTPVLLGFLQPARDVPVLRWWDAVAVAFTVVLAALIFLRQGQWFGGGIPLTPNLLLPSVLYMALRFGPRWTALGVALVALAAAWSQTTGHRPFGEGSPHETILHAQEFILTLSIVGMGFALLLGEQKALARELEDKVRERTQALEASNSKLAALSATDGPTGIANRRRFDEALAAEWARARRSAQPIGLALLDVDHFKDYNDRYGHQAGDECLRLVAEVMSAHVRRAGDLVARYGGEEFALLCPGPDAPGMVALARAVCTDLQQRERRHASSPFGVLTASIGVAVMVPGSEPTPRLLLEHADAALYEGKRRGRNQVVLHQEAAG